VKRGKSLHASEPIRSQPKVLSRSKGETFDEIVRDGLACREGDAGLASLKSGSGNFISMGRNCAGGQIEAALLSEGSIPRDDRFSDPKPRHFVFDDFFCVGQCRGKLSA